MYDNLTQYTERKNGQIPHMSDETSLKQILKATFFECKQTNAAAMPDKIDLCN